MQKNPQNWSKEICVNSRRVNEKSLKIKSYKNKNKQEAHKKTSKIKIGFEILRFASVNGMRNKQNYNNKNSTCIIYIKIEQHSRFIVRFFFFLPSLCVIVILITFFSHLKINVWRAALCYRCQRIRSVWLDLKFIPFFLALDFKLQMTRKNHIIYTGNIITITKLKITKNRKRRQ